MTGTLVCWLAASGDLSLHGAVYFQESQEQESQEQESQEQESQEQESQEVGDRPQVFTPAKVIAVHRVPWRWTQTRHVMVRAKINGAGPFNLIVDTGAPAVILHSQAAEKIQTAEPQDGVWLQSQTIEIEGGLVQENVRVAVIDMFQLEGMNGLGLAGVRLDGVLGYEFLARYRIEYDFDSTEMVWSELDFQPPAPIPTGGQTSLSLEAMGQLAKSLGAILGRGLPKPRPRGFLGIELGTSGQRLLVTKVIPGSPAEQAGLREQDQILEAKGLPVTDFAELAAATASLRVGDELKLTILRQEGGDKSRKEEATENQDAGMVRIQIIAKLGEGL